MERREELIELLGQIAIATKQARLAIDWVPDHNYWSVFQAMEFNAGVHGLLNDSNRFDVEWLDRAISFIIKETVPFNGQCMGDHKLEIILTSVLQESLRNCKGLLQPLRDILDAQDGLRQKYRRDQPSCLVLTALPVEFRALIRRAKRILGGSNVSAVSRILNKAEDEDKENRQEAWVECVLGNSTVATKAVVIIPKRDGSLHAQQAVANYLKNRPQAIRHVMVIGVAGHLDKENQLGIGDVVVSMGFYDVHRRKVETKSKGEISFSNKQPITLNTEHPFDIEAWVPKTVYETKPPRSKHRGFQVVKSGYIVSGPEVVKRPRYKKMLQNNFPEAIAVEMEAAGCYYAVEKNGIPVTIIKSICDWSTHTKNALWQPYCSDLAAAFAMDYILAIYGEPMASSASL